MIKVVRNPARKIEFKNQELVEPPKPTPKTKPVAKYNQPKEENQNKEIHEEIESITKMLEKKEQQLSQKEQELEKMAVLWANLNDIDLKTINQEEIKNITSDQKGFIKDLLEHYLDSEEKQKILKEKLQKSQEKPWAGKGGKEIDEENKNLKERNKELSNEINTVLDRIKQLEEENAWS
jgi:hypothetical protein